MPSGDQSHTSDGHGECPPVAATLVFEHDLPAARVLADGYLRHNPGHEFVVVVVDAPVDGLSWGEIRVHDARWLGMDRTEFLRMATGFEPAELVGALKPHLLRRLLADHPTALYLESDGQVLGAFPELAELAAEHGVVLTPRVLHPLPADAEDPDQSALAAAGPFDLGLVTVGQGARPLLDHWAKRTRDDIAERRTGPLGDARWAGAIPGLFEHLVLRDPGLNVGYWNAHERRLAEGPGGVVRAGDVPLRFLRAPGYRPDKPWLLSTHDWPRPRVLLSEEPVLSALFASYRQRLLEAGYRAPTAPPSGATPTAAPAPHGFSQLPDGTLITPAMRRLFRTEWLESERPDAEQVHFKRAIAQAPPHPFGDDQGAAFKEWLASSDSPLERAAGLNRLAIGAWHSRIDLQVAFPSPAGANAQGFRDWCRTHGLAEGLLPDWALPADPPPPRLPEDVLGVNVVGYLTAELGIGQMGRILHQVAEQTGLPVSSVTDEYTVSCRTALDAPGTTGSPRYPISVLTVNADYMEPLLSAYPETGHDRYRIGLWAWELEEFPEDLHHGFAFVDEVWTVSDYVRDAIAKHSPVPVKTFPVPVLDPGVAQRPDRRPGEPVTFFFTFDFNSTGGRKNPYGLVRAFRLAFGERDDVRLVIKTTNSALHAAAAERLRHQIGDDQRIELVDRYVSMAELEALYDDCDAYVSLHRSEGFGLTVAEAMARGLPVIATDYSSTTEFFDDSVGWTVPYELVPVGPGWLPYPADGYWADPDLHAAARAMREVADNPEEAARRGAAARERILRTRSMDAAAEWMRTQLEEAYRMWQERDHDAPASIDPKEPLNRVEQALHSKADSAAPSRVPLAPALRRAMLRALDHYDAHQRKVLGALLDGVRDSVDLLGDRVDRSRAETGDRISDTAAEVAALTARLERLERALGEQNPGPTEATPPNPATSADAPAEPNPGTNPATSDSSGPAAG